MMVGRALVEARISMQRKVMQSSGPTLRDMVVPQADLVELLVSSVQDE